MEFSKQMQIAPLENKNLSYMPPLSQQPIYMGTLQGMILITQ